MDAWAERAPVAPCVSGTCRRTAYRRRHRRRPCRCRSLRRLVAAGLSFQVAVKPVVPFAAEEQVVALAAEHAVVAGTAVDGVVLARAGDLIRLSPAAAAGILSVGVL